ncbi:hypothetical protein E2C01_073920 [Portunus trituberculatus]|uniref:Uncharacterized protein n=1 Tax=Portunus trituberculatus TaxID=210409 RepID=A0A5B7IFD3_PORTR|nr:hypothetical protein [Portunus trituberculatus]
MKKRLPVSHFSAPLELLRYHCVEEEVRIFAVFTFAAETIFVPLVLISGEVNATTAVVCGTRIQVSHALRLPPQDKWRGLGTTAINLVSCV